jgi:L-lactate dehydrogenase
MVSEVVRFRRCGLALGLAVWRQAFDRGEIAKMCGRRVIGSSGQGLHLVWGCDATVRICEAILRDEKVVLPVSTLMTGQYGIADVCLSLPRAGSGGRRAF